MDLRRQSYFWERSLFCVPKNITSVCFTLFAINNQLFLVQPITKGVEIKFKVFFNCVVIVFMRAEDNCIICIHRYFWSGDGFYSIIEEEELRTQTITNAMQSFKTQLGILSISVAHFRFKFLGYFNRFPYQELAGSQNTPSAWEELWKLQIKFLRGNAADLSFDAMLTKKVQNSFAIVFLSDMSSPLTVKDFEETVH